MAKRLMKGPKPKQKNVSKPDELQKERWSNITKRESVYESNPTEEECISVFNYVDDKPKPNPVKPDVTKKDVSTERAGHRTRFTLNEEPTNSTPNRSRNENHAFDLSYRDVQGSEMRQAGSRSTYETDDEIVESPADTSRFLETIPLIAASDHGRLMMMPPKTSAETRGRSLAGFNQQHRVYHAVLPSNNSIRSSNWQHPPMSGKESDDTYLLEPSQYVIYDYSSKSSESTVPSKEYIRRAPSPKKVITESVRLACRCGEQIEFTVEVEGEGMGNETESSIGGHDVDRKSPVRRVHRNTTDRSQEFEADHGEVKPQVCDVNFAEIARIPLSVDNRHQVYATAEQRGQNGGLIIDNSLESDGNGNVPEYQCRVCKREDRRSRFPLLNLMPNFHPRHTCRCVLRRRHRSPDPRSHIGGPPSNSPATHVGRIDAKDSKNNNSNHSNRRRKDGQAETSSEQRNQDGQSKSGSKQQKSSNVQSDGQQKNQNRKTTFSDHEKTPKEQTNNKSEQQKSLEVLSSNIGEKKDSKGQSKDNIEDEKDLKGPSKNSSTQETSSKGKQININEPQTSLKSPSKNTRGPQKSKNGQTLKSTTVQHMELPAQKLPFNRPSMSPRRSKEAPVSGDSLSPQCCGRRSVEPVEKQPQSKAETPMPEANSKETPLDQNVACSQVKAHPVKAARDKSPVKRRRSPTRSSAPSSGVGKWLRLFPRLRGSGLPLAKKTKTSKECNKEPDSEESKPRKQLTPEEYIIKGIGFQPTTVFRCEEERSNGFHQGRPLSDRDIIVNCSRCRTSPSRECRVSKPTSRSILKETKKCSFNGCSRRPTSDCNQRPICAKRSCAEVQPSRFKWKKPMRERSILFPRCRASSGETFYTAKDYVLEDSSCGVVCRHQISRAKCEICCREERSCAVLCRHQILRSKCGVCCKEDILCQHQIVKSNCEICCKLERPNGRICRHRILSSKCGICCKKGSTRYVLCRHQVLRSKCGICCKEEISEEVICQHQNSRSTCGICNYGERTDVVLCRHKISRSSCGICCNEHEPKVVLCRHQISKSSCGICVREETIICRHNIARTSCGICCNEEESKVVLCRHKISKSSCGICIREETIICRHNISRVSCGICCNEQEPKVVLCRHQISKSSCGICVREETIICRHNISRSSCGICCHEKETPEALCCHRISKASCRICCRKVRIRYVLCRHQILRSKCGICCKETTTNREPHCSLPCEHRCTKVKSNCEPKVTFSPPECERRSTNKPTCQLHRTPSCFVQPPPYKCRYQLPCEPRRTPSCSVQCPPPTLEHVCKKPCEPPRTPSCFVQPPPYKCRYQLPCEPRRTSSCSVECPPPTCEHVCKKPCEPPRTPSCFVQPPPYKCRYQLPCEPRRTSSCSVQCPPRTCEHVCKKPCGPPRTPSCSVQCPPYKCEHRYQLPCEPRRKSSSCSVECPPPTCEHVCKERTCELPCPPPILCQRKVQSCIRPCPPPAMCHRQVQTSSSHCVRPCTPPARPCRRPCVKRLPSLVVPCPLPSCEAIDQGCEETLCQFHPNVPCGKPKIDRQAHYEKVAAYRAEVLTPKLPDSFQNKNQAVIYDIHKENNGNPDKEKKVECPSETMNEKLHHIMHYGQPKSRTIFQSHQRVQTAPELRSVIKSNKQLGISPKPKNKKPNETAPKLPKKRAKSNLRDSSEEPKLKQFSLMDILAKI